jgi:signal transduction histidine kinase
MTRKKKLDSGITKELPARRQHAAELEGLEVEYRQRTKMLLKVDEEERRSIAHEVHDDLCQPLTALKIILSGMKRRIPKDEGPLLEKVEQLLELTDTTTETARRISVELRPGVLDDLGLIAAIEWQTKYFAENTGIACELDIAPVQITLDGQLSTAIFRILRKILANIQEQATATIVRVSLTVRAGKLKLKVTDNGIWTSGEEFTNQLPFKLMEIGERAYLFGSEVKSKRNPDRGITVTLTIPLIPKEASYDKAAYC